MSALLIGQGSGLERKYAVVEEGPDYQIRLYVNDGSESYFIAIKKTLYEKLQRIAKRAGVTSLQMQTTYEDARQELARYRKETAAAATARELRSIQPKPAANHCSSSRTPPTAAAAKRLMSHHPFAEERPPKAARSSAAATPVKTPVCDSPPKTLCSPVQTPAAASDAATTSEAAVTHSLTGSILSVKQTYNQACDIDSSSRIQLGLRLAQGGFACEYMGKILQLGDTPAPTAAAAEAASADVVVKVYHASAPGHHPEVLQFYASNEHLALRTLQSQEAVVKLLADANLDPADAAGSGLGAAAGVQHSQYIPGGSGSKWNGSSSSGQEGYMQSCLVLEYLPKGAISNIPVKCTEEEAKTLLRPVLRTLKVMHSGDLGVRIIHRNIRPENLLQRVSKAGLMVELVLADFCCSSVEVKPEVKHPATASIYQAPKLPSIAGFAGAADGGLAASADCYAVGVTVMQLLGCLRVHAGLDDQAVQQQVVEFVDAPGDGEASAAVREFVGCCCGGGRGWLFAASRGRASSMTAAHLLETAWMRL